MSRRRVRRRARRAGLIRLGVLVLVLVLGAIAVVASATGSGPFSSSKPAVKHAARPPAAVRKASRSRPRPSRSAQLARADARATNGVLSYTPFITAGVPRHRVIALTFDDGPSPYTPGIVRELVRMHVPATFFIVGQQLNDFAAALRDELRNGFAVGDHTENHAPLTALGQSGQYGQIHDAAARLTRLGAPFPRLFRPPYGVYDRTTLATLGRMKMLMTMWSIDPKDWTRPGTAVIVQRVLSAARPGTIVELHDGGGDRSQTEAALPAIIKALRRRRYAFVTVPELLRLDPPPRNQHLPSLSE